MPNQICEFHPKAVTFGLPMLTFDQPLLNMHASAKISAWGRSKVNTIQNYVDV